MEHDSKILKDIRMMWFKPSSGLHEMGFDNLAELFGNTFPLRIYSWVMAIVAFIPSLNEIVREYFFQEPILLYYLIGMNLIDSLLVVYAGLSKTRKNYSKADVYTSFRRIIPRVVITMATIGITYRYANLNGSIWGMIEGYVVTLWVIDHILLVLKTGVKYGYIQNDITERFTAIFKRAENGKANT